MFETNPVADSSGAFIGKMSHFLKIKPNYTQCSSTLFDLTAVLWLGPYYYDMIYIILGKNCNSIHPRTLLRLSWVWKFGRFFRPHDQLHYADCSLKFTVQTFQPMLSRLSLNFCFIFLFLFSTQRTIRRRTHMMDGQSSSPLQDAFLNISDDMLLLPSFPGCRERYRKTKPGELCWCRKPNLRYKY